MDAVETLVADLKADRFAAILLARALEEGGDVLLEKIPRPFLERALRHLRAEIEDRKAAKRDPRAPPLAK